MTHTPALALATEIATQVVGLTLGTNVFRGTMRAPGTGIPINAVFAWGGGGAAPLRTMSDPDEIRRAVVHVRVRDAKFVDGEAVTFSILNGLRGRDVATYLEMKVSESGPLSFGQNSNGQHVFGLTYIMTYQEP